MSISSKTAAVSALTVALLGVAIPQAQARPPGYWHGGGDGYALYCESNNYRYQHCRVDTRGGVQLLRQTSRTPCRQGINWGYNRRGIWVDRGCAAEFAVGVAWIGPGRPGGPGHGPGPGWDRPGHVVSCRSYGYRDAYCRAEVRRSVQIVRQISRAPCHYGRTWGYDRGGIWVRNGCSAEFRIV